VLQAKCCVLRAVRRICECLGADRWGGNLESGLGMIWGPVSGALFLTMFIGTIDALRTRAYEVSSRPPPSLFLSCSVF
jgi:hypothetical protein